MAVSWAGKLLQHRQLRDKNSRGIPRDVWKLSLYFKMYVCVCVFYNFSQSSAEPWHSAKTWLRNRD